MTTFSCQLDSPLYKGGVNVPTQLFINGEWIDPVKPETINVYNPTTGKVITSVAIGSAQDVDIAVKAARHAFRFTWGLNAPGHRRGELLNKLADLIERDAEEIAALETLNMGVPFLSSKNRTVLKSMKSLRYHAGWAGKIVWTTIETDPAKFAYTRREPIGVCGQILPWNVPFSMFIMKIAPALACGCTVVVKPSEFIPLSALKACELIKEAGFPSGVVNLIVGYGDDVGQAIITHHDINKISFTGSTLVGRKILHASADSNLKRVLLELGGKSPNVILDDADLDQAIKWTATGLYWNSGQVCSAGSRIFVQERIYDSFVKAFTESSKALKLGDPFSEETAQGPQISKIQFDRVMGYIDIGKKEGTTLSFGGERHGTEEFFIQPTIFTDVKPDMRICREEIFGPVGVIIKFKTDQEVIELANDTTYGLAAAVFTTNINRAINISNSLQAGSVFVNCHNWSDNALPWGGYKESGWGKEMGQAVHDEYTEVKAVHVNIGMRL